MKLEKAIGRPSGKKKTAKIEVVIEPDIKEAFMSAIHNEGKTASVQICSWIREYLKSKEDGDENK